MRRCFEGPRGGRVRGCERTRGLAGSPGRSSGLRGERLVVGGVEFFVGAGAGDAHAGSAFGVEEEGGAPAVEEFAGGAANGGVVGRDQGEAQFVFPGEDTGDFGVGADGVAAEGLAGLNL